MRTQRSTSIGAALASLLVTLVLAIPTASLAGAQAKVNVEKAKVAFSSGEYKKALDLLEEAIAEEPENAEAYHYAGLCMIALDKPGEAVPLLERSAALDGANASINEDLAWAKLGAGDFGGAVDSADVAMSYDSASERARLYKGQGLMVQENFDDALLQFEDVPSGSSFEQAAAVYGGVCLYRLGRVDDAKASFQRAVDLDSASELGKEAAKYLAALEGGAPAQEKPWMVRGRLYYQYDSNIIPARDEVVGVTPPGGDEPPPRQSDGRFVVDLDARYDYRSGPYGVGGRYLGYASFYTEEDEFNLVFNMGEVNGFYQFDVNDTNLRLGGAFDYMNATLDGEQYSDVMRGLANATAFWNEAMATKLEFEYWMETFEGSVEDTGGPATLNEGANNRDNNRWYVSLTQYFTNPNGSNASFWFGGRYGDVAADGDNYNRNETRFFGGVMVSPEESWYLTLTGSWENTDFYDYMKDVPGANDRVERRTNLAASFIVPVYKWISLYTGISYTSVDSTIVDLEYDRTITSLGVMGEL